MTVIEYMTQLGTRAHWVGPRDMVPLETSKTGGALVLYEVLMLVQLKNGTYQGVIQPFYVVGEDTAEEIVYPVNQERGDTPPDPFATEVRTFADTFITATRPKVTVDQVDEANRFAICTAYEDDGVGNIVTARYFVAKDGTDTFYIQPYTG